MFYLSIEQISSIYCGCRCYSCSLSTKLRHGWLAVLCFSYLKQTKSERVISENGF